MNSTERATSIIFGFGFAALVAIVFMISSCTIRQIELRAPADAIAAKSEHIQRVYCIRNRGEWTQVDKNGYNTVVYCNFK